MKPTSTIKLLDSILEDLARDNARQSGDCDESGDKELAQYLKGKADAFAKARQFLRNIRFDMRMDAPLSEPVPKK